MASKSGKSISQIIAHDPSSASCGCPSCAGGGETGLPPRFEESNGGIQDPGYVISAAPWRLEVDDADGIFNGKQIFELDQVIGQLDSGARLHAPNGVVTYTFLTTPHAIGYYNNPNFSIRDADGYSPFSAEQQAAAREAIQLWDDLVPLSFVESRGAGADVVFANTSTGPAQAHAFYPGIGQRVVSDVWTATPEVNPSNEWLNYNGYGWTTVVHELGHAIGLSHPGSYNFSANFSTTYTNGAEYAQDTR
ncbi:MAG TPA: matrixin family metalloprotease, partial [Sphingomicrobium sp.]